MFKPRQRDWHDKISLRASLQQWLFYFITGNILFFWLIGLNYCSVIPWIDTSYVLPRGKFLLTFFAGTCYFGQLGMLAALPLLIFFPLSYLIRKTQLFIPFVVINTAIFAIILIVDTYIYKLYRFHLSGILINLVLHGSGEQVLGISNKESFIITFVILAIISFEILYAWMLWRFKHIKLSFLKWLLFFSLACLYISYCMIAFSFGFLVNRIMLDVARTMPLYAETFSIIFPIKNNQLIFNRLSEIYTVQAKKFSAPLNYPLHVLKFAELSTPYNLVIIVIDTWRYDMLNANITPYLSAFAKKSLVFTQHTSGGNATGPGIFSLFYGLPASYWSAMEKEQRGPILLQELMKRKYQMAVFSSAELFSPPLNKTVFADLKNLDSHQQPASTAYERDQLVTKRFQHFLMNRSSQPFFSFLFYDAAHSYCEFNDDLKPLKPVVQQCNRMELTATLDPTTYFNRYKNALMLVDHQIHKVLDSLEKNNLLQNTIVIITGDHGEEFNDNHLGFWGHASNFTRFQTHTPLIVYWPKVKPQLVTYQTSHFDLIPTLMQKLLHCQSEIQDYSFGHNLLTPINRNYYILGSYISLGIIEPQQITEISQSGHFDVKQLNGGPSTLSPNQQTLAEAFDDMRHFLQWK